MRDYSIDQLIDLRQVRELLESHHRLSGMAYGLFDIHENNLIAVGWQDICMRFHRVHPVTCARCRESDAFIKAHLHDTPDQLLEYRCKNNMIDIAMPIMIEGKHSATFFTGQFFYEDDPPDPDFFLSQARELGFDTRDYLAALARVPLFSREHIRGNVIFLHNMVQVLAETGLKNLRLVREMEVRRQAEDDLREHRDRLEEVVRQRTADMEAARDEAERANRAKSIFLANMSHELRTPLNAVLGFSQLLRRSPELTAEQAESLDIISRSGEHLLTLINNVLDISKIEAGRVELDESAVDLHHVLQDVLSLMGVRAREKGLDAVLDQAPDLPRQITIDGGKLRQVLINLVSNAVKFTARGCVILRAKVVKEEGPERVWLGFAVEDSGPGVAEEDRERIFQPFVQLSTWSGEVGTGLGLTICRQHVQLMGGSIGVGDSPGGGAVFHFELPATVLGSDASPGEVQQGHAIGLADGERRHRLLIAEDQPENRLLLHRMLQPLGFEVREACNGQEALDLYREWHPELIWMDVRMPVMDGMEATRRIRATGPTESVKIVAVTAHALEGERREIMAAGCDDVIRKPYESSQILDALTHHLGVRFVYDQQAPPVTATLPQAADLQALPDPLLDTLARALMLLDPGEVRQAIEAVRGADPSLADGLAAVAGSLQYGALLRLVEQARKQPRVVGTA